LREDARTGDAGEFPRDDNVGSAAGGLLLLIEKGATFSPLRLSFFGAKSGVIATPFLRSTT
jgi:hypothetical protein